MPAKLCPICGDVKPLADFPNNSDFCIHCQEEYEREQAIEYEILTHDANWLE